MLVTTPAIMEDLREVLGRPHLRLRIGSLQTSVAEPMESPLGVVDVIPIWWIGFRGLRPQATILRALAIFLKSTEFRLPL